MKKLKTFLHVLALSTIPLEDYYKKVVSAPLTFSFKYFIALVVVTHFFTGLVVFSKELSSYGSIWKLSAGVREMLDQFPSDLDIIVQNGHLRTTYDRPYIIWLNRTTRPYPLFVIDERSKAQKIAQYDSLLLANRDGIVTRVNDTIAMYRFRDSDNLLLNRQTIDQTTPYIDGLLSLLPTIVIGTAAVLVLASTAVALFSKLVYLSLMATFTFIASMFFIEKIKLKEVLQLSFHSVTAPILMESLIKSLGLSVKLTFWFPLLFIIFLVAALYEVYGITPGTYRTSQKRRGRRLHK